MYIFTTLNRLMQEQNYIGKGWLVVLLLMVAYSAIAQLKSTVAERVTIPPKIDGIPDDSCWARLQSTATDFVQYEPVNGSLPYRQTEVKMVYNDRSVYFCAILRDTDKDSILTEFSKRDEERINADDFAIEISPFNDGINGYGFKVTAAGVQIDYKITSDSKDYNWDAVWRSEVNITPEGWVVEMEIPYSSIRFPKTEVQSWGINFWRQIRRSREYSTWSFIDKTVDGQLSQMGIVKGIENIKSPLRLSATPYISGYLNKESDLQKFSYSFNFGMDLKYGINESFTLDLTLIPDFGQVQSDDEVLNLSPYETYYGEKRPFFTEGTELFSKGGIFYSRRIGGRPRDYYTVLQNLEEGEEIVRNPGETNLINATKLSGRTNSGLGIGVFNAITGATEALVADSLGNIRSVVTQPLSNYNMFVLNQSMKNNSSISFFNTNVASHQYSANVSGGEIKLLDKNRSYALVAKGISSQHYTRELHPALGYAYFLRFSKVSGNFRFDLSRNSLSDTYDINDMGYLTYNNFESSSAGVSYSIYNPFWIMLNWHNNLSLSYNNLFAKTDYNSRFNSLIINFQSNTTFKNYLSVGFNINGTPIDRYDYFEPRVDGRRFLRAPYISSSIWLSPDYRKRFVVDLRGGYSYSSMFSNNSYNYNIGPRIRISDRAFVVYGFGNWITNNEPGFVSYTNDSILFGLRDVVTFENKIEGRYIFSSKSSLSLRVRHYWSQVEYKDFYNLEMEGELSPIDYIYSLSSNEYINTDDYNHEADINYNAFTIDMTYYWNFAPGSELSIVWKNQLHTSSNQIITNYYSDVERMFENPYFNSISLKFLYYFDYQYIKKIKKP